MRRWLISQQLFLVGAIGVGLVLVAMGVLVALLPPSVRAAVTSLSAGPVQRQNAALHRELASEEEKAADLVVQLEQLLQRGRRLAWALGVTEGVVGFGVEAPPGAAAGVSEIAAWLEVHGERLARLAEVVASQAETARPCDLFTLPTGAPLEPSRAVPVANFGWHVSPFTGKDEAHHGVTLAAPAGEAVRAPGAGRVVYAGSPRHRRANEWMKWGSMVIVDHGCGRLTLFGHLGEINVRPGATVRRGEKLGSVGVSGWTRVPALYWEVRWPVGGRSRPIDPALVALWLRVDDVEGRFTDPSGGLPESFAPLESLRLVP